MSIQFSKCQEAKTFSQKVICLMFRNGISEDFAMFFYHTRSIHTFFMRFPIDILFLNQEMEVIKICDSVKPWKVRVCFGAYCVIECAAGGARKKGIKRGSKLAFL